MSAVCQVADCAGEPYRLSLCQRHYARQWRYGDPLTHRRAHEPS